MGAPAPPTLKVPFCDLRAAHRARARQTEEALLRVARSGRYVLGAEVRAFENEFASRCGAAHAAGVGNGTDAIALILRAAGIGAGDEVVVPAYTATATWTAVTMAGARPVGADVDAASGLLSPSAAEDAIGTRTRALIAVHLFGRLAPIDELRARCDRRGLLLIEDAAHAHGVEEDGRRAGSLGDAAAFSFYPTKTMGGLGDGGAVVSGDSALAEAVRRLRSYGWSEWQGRSPSAGCNSRLDEIQAAVLRGRLAELDGIHARLRELARVYRTRLRGLQELALPLAPRTGEPPWHQFVVRHPRRDRLREQLAKRGIGTAVHYDPLPPALQAFSSAASFPAAERFASCAVSLPFDPWLSEAQVSAVCDALCEAIGSSERSLKWSSGS